MLNPLWVDARDYLTNKGVPITTGNLNSAMGFLAQNVDARPSYAKASPDAATSIGAGLGMPTDDFSMGGPNIQDLGEPSSIKATPLAAPNPTSYAPPQTQTRPQPRAAGTPTRTEKTASTRSQPKALPVNNRAETASGRSDPITSPVSTGSAPNIHATPDNAPLPPNVNPAIPDVSNGAYAPGGLEVDSIGPGALLGAGGLGAALLGMILSKGRGGRVPNAPRIPGVGASPLVAESALANTRLPPGSPPPITGPAPVTGPTPVGAPPPVYTPTGPAIPQAAAPRVQLPTGSPSPVYTPPAMTGPTPIRGPTPVRGPAPVSGTMEDILTAPPRNTAPTKPVATKREPGQAALYPTPPKGAKAAAVKRKAAKK